MYTHTVSRTSKVGVKARFENIKYIVANLISLMG